MLSVLTVVISVALSTAVAWFLGPLEIIRHEKARRSLELRRRFGRILLELLRRLRNEEIERRRLEDGGQATFCWSIKDYEGLLWPVVRALDSPDLPRRLATALRTKLRELLGSWRFEYLSVCVTKELENALSRYPVQPRDLQEPLGLLEKLYPDRGASEPARVAAEKVQEILDLIR